MEKKSNKHNEGASHSHYGHKTVYFKKQHMYIKNVSYIPLPTTHLKRCIYKKKEYMYKEYQVQVHEEDVLVSTFFLYYFILFPFLVHNTFCFSRLKI